MKSENKHKIIFRTILCLIETILICMVVFSFAQPRKAFTLLSEDMYSSNGV